MITGNPRIVLTVGVSTLYAVAVTGALSSSHTFRLTISASHKDLDGIEHATPVELNGGRIVDNSGNSSGLDFTVASTAGVLVNSLEFNGTVQAILPLSDGKVVVAGEFTSLNGSPYNRIVRLTADHKIDTTFNPGTGFDGTVKDLILSQDGTGDYYAVGCFIKYNDNSRAGVVRINSDGSIDTSFDPGIGIENDTVCGSNARIETIKHTNDGSNDIYLGGKFEKYNGYPVRNFVRVNADGTRDTSFDTGNKLPQYKTTYSIEVPRDGSDTVVISGDFEDFNGNASYSTLFRISPTGDLVAPWGSLSSSLVHYVKNARGKDQRFLSSNKVGCTVETVAVSFGWMVMPPLTLFFQSLTILMQILFEFCRIHFLMSTYMWVDSSRLSAHKLLNVS